MSNLSRRSFLIGGSSAAAVVAISATTSLIAGENKKATSEDNVTTTTNPPPRIASDVDPSSWFDDPKNVAKLGASTLGATIVALCDGATSNSISTADEYAAAVQAEQGCSTLQQIGYWFLTPTEVAVAQRLAKQNL